MDFDGDTEGAVSDEMYDAEVREWEEYLEGQNEIRRHTPLSYEVEAQANGVVWLEKLNLELWRRQGEGIYLRVVSPEGRHFQDLPHVWTPVSPPEVTALTAEGFALL